MWIEEEVVYLEEDERAMGSIDFAESGVSPKVSKAAKRTRSGFRKSTLQDAPQVDPFHYEGEDDGGFDAEPSSPPSASSSFAADSELPRRSIFRLTSVSSRHANSSIQDAVEDFEDFGDAAFNKVASRNPPMANTKSTFADKRNISSNPSTFITPASADKAKSTSLSGPSVLRNSEMGRGRTESQQGAGVGGGGGLSVIATQQDEYPAHWRATSQTAPGPRRAVPMVPERRRRESLPASTRMSVRVLKPKALSLDSPTVPLQLDQISFRPSWMRSGSLMRGSSRDATPKAPAPEDIEAVADDEMTDDTHMNSTGSGHVRSFAVNFAHPPMAMHGDTRATSNPTHFDDYDDLAHQDHHTSVGGSPGLRRAPHHHQYSKGRRAGHFSSLLRRVAQQSESNRTRWGHIRRENMRFATSGRMPEARDLSDPRCSSKTSIDCAVIGAVANEYLMSTFGADVIVVQIVSFNARAEGSLKHTALESNELSNCSHYYNVTEGSVVVFFADSDISRQLSDLSDGKMSVGSVIRVYDYQLIPPQLRPEGVETAWRTVVSNPSASYALDDLLRHSVRVLCSGVVEVLGNQLITHNSHCK